MSRSWEEVWGRKGGGGEGGGEEREGVFHTQGWNVVESITGKVRVEQAALVLALK
jgi:hypothetical protein